MNGPARPTEDDYLTLRVPRFFPALLIALILHVVAARVASRMTPAKNVSERVEFTFAAPAPPAPPLAPAPEAPRRSPPKKASPRPAASPPPQTSPVVPVLPPSAEDRPRVALAEPRPEPAPPSPPSWKDLALRDLAATRVAPKLPAGPLLPSFSALDSVAMNDASLHDDANERRLMEDHGVFFQRGLEALRGQWRPQEVLNETERDPARRCGRRNRVTFAVAVLDRQGNVVDVDLKNPSGCRDLDQEAVRAFLRVARFPHPPAGIFVAPDGTPTDTARYPVRFIVTFDGGLQLDWRG